MGRFQGFCSFILIVAWRDRRFISDEQKILNFVHCFGFYLFKYNSLGFRARMKRLLGDTVPRNKVRDKEL